MFVQLVEDVQELEIVLKVSIIFRDAQYIIISIPYQVLANILANILAIILAIMHATLF